MVRLLAVRGACTGGGHGPRAAFCLQDPPVQDAGERERERSERLGLLSKYRALRKFLTGPPGSGKSRTVRAIAVMRAAAARSAAERTARMERGVKKDMVTKRGDEAARGACLLGAPTGTASFQIKAGASTLHRLFSIPIHQFLPIRDAEKLSLIHI